MSQAPHKVCPQCHTPAYLQAPQCTSCGHVFRTQFPPSDQTMMVGGPAPYQPPPAYAYPPAPRPDCIQLPPGTHSPITAALLTLLLTGAGQMYNKQVIKGVVILVSALVLGALTGCLAIPVALVVAGVDAYQIGHRLHRGEAVGQWQWF